jgi:hypothetical protein
MRLWAMGSHRTPCSLHTRRRRSPRLRARLCRTQTAQEQLVRLRALTEPLARRTRSGSAAAAHAAADVRNKALAFAAAARGESTVTQPLFCLVLLAIG